MAKTPNEPTTKCPTCKQPITYAPKGVLLHDTPSACPIVKWHVPT